MRPVEGIHYPPADHLAVLVVGLDQEHHILCGAAAGRHVSDAERVLNLLAQLIHDQRQGVPRQRPVPSGDGDHADMDRVAPPVGRAGLHLVQQLKKGDGGDVEPIRL